MRRLFFLLALLPALALAQGYQPVRANCPSCVLTAQSLTLSGALSASTVTASTSVQTPDIKGAGGQDRILLPTGDVTTIKGGTNTANFLNFTGTAAGVAPSIAASGSDTNVSINLSPKGGGTVFIGGRTNSLTLSGAASGAAPTVFATGGDTNIDLSLAPKGTGGVQIGGKISKYNGVSTAGMGVSPIYAYGSQTAISTTGTTVATYTPSAQGIFEVGGFLDVTAYTSGSIGLQLNFTDCSGTSRVYNIEGETSAPALAASLGATGSLGMFAQTICANAATIALKTNISGTSTSDFYGWIKQVQ